jgi:AsmA protein
MSPLGLLKNIPRAFAGMLAALLICLAALAAIGFAHWTFSSEALIGEVASQVYASAGLYIAAKGRSTFSLLPRPHIAIERVALADPGAFMTLEADRLDGDVRLLPLLARRLEIDRLTLTRPAINVDPQKAPTFGAVPVNIPSSATPRAVRNARFGSVSLVDGAITLRGEKPQVIDRLDATLEWRESATPATLTGEFNWGNEHFRGLLWIARPDVLRHGDQTPLSLRLDGDLLHIEAEGMAQAGVMPRYIARIAGSAPSLRRALALLNISAPLPGPLENCELAAQASIGLTDMQLSQLKFLADNNEFEGSFALSQEDGRAQIKASLSSRYLSLKPLLDYLPTLSSGDGQWSRENFDLPDLSGADVELRLQATHAHLSRLAIDDAELGLNMRAGRLDFQLANAKAYKGTISARATLAMGAQNAVEAHAEVQSAGLDAGSLLWDAVAHEDITGSLDSTVVLNAVGDSMAAMMRDLDGRASLTLNQGAIAGIDLTRAMSRVEKRPLSSAMYIRSGRSSVEKASATVKITNGMASVEDGSASGPGFSLAFTGSTRVLDRSLALRAQVYAADESGLSRSKGQQLSFELIGPWDELNFVTDAKALIRRSGAAAPLLPPPAPPTEPENQAKQR